MNGFERCTHLPIANNVRDHNDFSSRITGFKLNDRLNGDVVVAEAAANAADHAWCILCFETHVVSLAGLLLVGQVAGAPAGGCEQGVEVSVCWFELANASNVEDVGNHGRSSGS